MVDACLGTEDGVRIGTIADQISTIDMPRQKGDTPLCAPIANMRLRHSRMTRIPRTIFNIAIGSMRRCKFRCAVHQLCGLLYRMQDPNAKAKEDTEREGKGLG